MSSASYCSFLIPTEASEQTTRRGTTRKITAASVQNGAVVRDSGECVCNISVHRRNGLTTLYGIWNELWNGIWNGILDIKHQ